MKIAGNLCKSSAGRALALLHVLAETSPNLKKVSKQSQQDLLDISRFRDLSAMFERNPLDAVAELYTRKALHASHQGDADRVMHLLVAGPSEARNTMTMVTQLKTLYPDMKLYPDTRPEHGQKVLVIKDTNDGIRVQKMTYDADENVFVHPSPERLISRIEQNSDGSVQITDLQTGEEEMGLVRYADPVLEPEHKLENDAPNAGL